MMKWLTEYVPRNGIMKMYDEMVHWICMMKWYIENVRQMVHWKCMTKWYTENVRQNGTLKMYNEIVHCKCMTKCTLQMYDEIDKTSNLRIQVLMI
jgi:hypothetical protein